MLIHRTFTQRVRTLELASALSATMVAMSAPEASADQGAIESPFTKVEDFASDIKDYVGSVADKAEKEAARKQRAADRAAVVAEADDQLGVPYVYGGTSLTNGADCSGFVMSVYKNFGVNLPHSSAADRSVGAAVNGLENAQPGDIICYSGHVGIYAGNGQIVHASTSKTGIIVSSATYRSILSIRRIL